MKFKIIVFLLIFLLQQSLQNTLNMQQFLNQIQEQNLKLKAGKELYKQIDTQAEKNNLRFRNQVPSDDLEILKKKARQQLYQELDHTSQTNSSQDELNNYQPNEEELLVARIDQENKNMMNSTPQQKNLVSKFDKNYFDRCSNFELDFNDKLFDQWESLKNEYANLEYNQDQNGEPIIKYERIQKKINNKYINDSLKEFDSVFIVKDNICANGILYVNLQPRNCDPNSEYGIVFRYIDSNNFMTFEVQPIEKIITVMEKVDGNWTLLHQEISDVASLSVYEEYKNIIIDFQNTNIKITFQKKKVIEVPQNKIFFGSIGILVKDMQEIFIKDFKLISESKYLYIKKDSSQKIEEKIQVTEIPVKENDEKTKIKETKITDEQQLQIYQFQICSKEKSQQYGCDNYSDNSCKIIACKRCCKEYNHDPEKCEKTCSM